jgi:hypothetical protein
MKARSREKSPSPRSSCCRRSSSLTLSNSARATGPDFQSSGCRRGSVMRKQPAQIVTNKRSPVVHVSTEVPRPLGEAFEDIARANGITKAELLRRLIQALVEKMKTRR